jgi:hypothetical protein
VSPLGQDLRSFQFRPYRHERGQTYNRALVASDTRVVARFLGQAVSAASAVVTVPPSILASSADQQGAVGAPD